MGSSFSRALGKRQDLNSHVCHRRIRHYGLLSFAPRKLALAAARAALDVPPPQAAVIESVAEFMQRVAHIEHTRCPHCRIGQFRVVATLLPRRDLPNPRGPPR